MVPVALTSPDMTDSPKDVVPEAFRSPDTTGDTKDSAFPAYPAVRAGGGVVWRRTSVGRIEVVLVHHSIYAEWSLPKGKLDAGEDLVSCALREVEEETGLACNTGEELAIVHYVDRLGRAKAVHYWTMQAKDSDASEDLHRLSPSMEIDDAKWAPIAYALSEANLPRDRLVLWSFAGQLGMTAGELARENSLLSKLEKKAPLLLVRHASAGDRAGWMGDDRERTLDAKGQAQSAKLAARLASFPIETILSSPAMRCIQTVEPLAEVTGAQIEIDERLAEGQVSRAVEVIADARSRGAVLCTHGDVVEAALSSVASACTLPLPGDGAMKKASVWALNGNGGTAAFRVAAYLPPPSL